MELFDDLEFMFTTTRATVVQPTGKRTVFCGDIHSLKVTIQTIHWLYLSKYHTRWYALVTFTDGRCGYIRCSFENFWSEENTLRFYVSAAHTELIQYAMKYHAYKSYRRQFSNSATVVSASSSP